MKYATAASAVYESPEIAAIDTATAQILCQSGSIPNMDIDNDGNELFG